MSAGEPGAGALMTQVHTETLEATVLGRYLVRPGAEPQDSLLVTFHGYAENAERNLEAIVQIPGIHDWTVVAVQALHPFYNSRSGEVVASWMTRLDRESAIDHNTRYVGRVVERVRASLDLDGPLVYAGFSQGTAMAYRAAAGSGHPCDGIIALGGDVPPELAERASGRFPPVLIGRGEADDWYTQEKVERDLARLEKLGASVELCVFDGGHEWSAEFYRRCGDFLTRCRAAP